MAQVTIPDIKKTDNYVGLSAANKADVDAALSAIATAFGGSIVLDKDGLQDNIYMVFKEAIEQQVIE